MYMYFGYNKKFAILQVISWYPESLYLRDVPLNSDVNDVLEKFTIVYYDRFTSKYTGRITFLHTSTSNMSLDELIEESFGIIKGSDVIIAVCFSSSLNLAHKCNSAGCNSVLVLDGNMKNHQPVCKAQDAGYVKYGGLPGMHNNAIWWQ